MKVTQKSLSFCSIFCLFMFVSDLFFKHVYPIVATVATIMLLN